MGRTPAEIAEGAGDIGMGDCRYIGAVFCNGLILLKPVFLKFLPLKAWIRALTLHTPHGQVENATASSAGGSPAPDLTSDLARSYGVVIRSPGSGLLREAKAKSARRRPVPRSTMGLG